jgi:hypothetical protein
LHRQQIVLPEQSDPCDQSRDSNRRHRLAMEGDRPTRGSTRLLRTTSRRVPRTGHAPALLVAPASRRRQRLPSFARKAGRRAPAFAPSASARVSVGRAPAPDELQASAGGRPSRSSSWRRRPRTRIERNSARSSMTRLPPSNGHRPPFVVRTTPAAQERLVARSELASRRWTVLARALQSASATAAIGARSHTYSHWRRGPCWSRSSNAGRTLVSAATVRTVWTILRVS